MSLTNINIYSLISKNFQGHIQIKIFLRNFIQFHFTQLNRINFNKNLTKI